MTDQTTPRQAAQLLWQHRCAGTVLDALPSALRPATAAQGHAIQAQLPLVAGQRIVGWKIAATSVAGQKHINVGGPLAGRILSGFVLGEDAAASLTGNRMRVVEPEFAFRIARDLVPRSTPYSVDEVLAGVASLHPAFEVPDSRYAVFTSVGEAQLIADDACCGPFRFGPAAPASWRELDLAAHRVHASVSNGAGSRYTREGEGRAALGDPRIALTWLVNELSALGIPLAAGQFVSTGTCMVPLETVPGDTVHADFGALGALTLRVSA
jgi:2-keto-4-pentenoate hydratase